MITVLCGIRLKIVDTESVPVHLLPGLIRYTPWLIGQIIQSSLHVARRVLSPKLPISPTIIHIDTQQTDAAEYRDHNRRDSKGQQKK